jgi:hypothetical protein
MRAWVTTIYPYNADSTRLGPERDEYKKRRVDHPITDDSLGIIYCGKRKALLKPSVSPALVSCARVLASSQ